MPKAVGFAVGFDRLNQLHRDLLRRYAKLLRKRFLDGLPMHGAANQLNMSEANAYRKQKEALRHLALIIQTEERHLRQARRRALEQRPDLPPQIELVGVDRYLDHLSNVVLPSKSPWLICLDGLGGLGKTTLAHALILRPNILDHFQQLAWVVVDNLETLADYQTLLPTLLKLTNPSKFLLTSRHSLRAHPDVFSCTLPELSLADTLRLIRQEAEARGLAEVAEATAEQLQSIHHVVGGNPLALKLVVGQLSMLSLTQVLENLKQAQSRTIDELYSYIYWQAWQMLDTPSQHVFLMMPLANDGPLAQLQAITQLDPAALSRAVQMLGALSLVQVKGTLEERRYSLHRLTETFLLNEAIKWKASA